MNQNEIQSLPHLHDFFLPSSKIRETKIENMKTPAEL